MLIFLKVAIYFQSKKEEKNKKNREDVRKKDNQLKKDEKNIGKYRKL